MFTFKLSYVLLYFLDINCTIQQRSPLCSLEEIGPRVASILDCKIVTAFVAKINLESNKELLNKMPDNYISQHYSLLVYTGKILNFLECFRKYHLPEDTFPVGKPMDKTVSIPDKIETELGEVDGNDAEKIIRNMRFNIYCIKEYRKRMILSCLDSLKTVHNFFQKLEIAGDKLDLVRKENKSEKEVEEDIGNKNMHEPFHASKGLESLKDLLKNKKE
ncbi:hypothetical protein SLOPH_461 [Spraguea lophii 42_110]|uniref:Uncharacterized protein n=1 Tax=Spraguea lophii (strain 42_110) TaxID=1358809 RepID=S7XGY7_SPRLO|nr:hypothetical protein SLOPH_461 [Spraguea lophii 42_110]